MIFLLEDVNMLYLEKTKTADVPSEGHILCLLVYPVYSKLLVIVTVGMHRSIFRVVAKLECPMCVNTNVGRKCTCGLKDAVGRRCRYS